MKYALIVAATALLFAIFHEVRLSSVEQRLMRQELSVDILNKGIANHAVWIREIARKP